MNPEDIARVDIDELLMSTGFAIQDMSEFDRTAAGTLIEIGATGCADDPVLTAVRSTTVPCREWSGGRAE